MSEAQLAARGTRRGSSRLRSVGYVGEAAAAWPLFTLLRLLPYDTASRLAASMFRTVGRRSSLTRRAGRQLGMIYPELSASARDSVISGMWDNIGRIVVDYAHLPRLIREPDRIEVNGGEYLPEAAREGPVLLFAAHLANWEVATLAAHRRGLQPGVVYRPFNNPIIERYARRLQSATGAELIRKSAAGTRRIVGALEAGGQVIMLVDQRLNSGISVPFFGRPAMTAPALAKLAYRFNATVVPVQVERLGGTRFRATIEPPIPLPRSGDRAADVETVMTEVNSRLESWIRERPEQWLWLHRRWAKGTA